MKTWREAAMRCKGAGWAITFCCAVLTTTGGIASADGWRVARTTSFDAVFDRTPAAEAVDAFRGALLMRWDRKRFREFSGLHLFDGNRIAAVSDRGVLLQVTLEFREGWLAGASRPRLVRLRGENGDKLKRKDGDAESLTADRVGGLIVAFERRPRLLQYRPPFSGTPRKIEMPDAIAEFPKNRGIEALSRLCDGRLLILAQGALADAPDAWVGGPGGWTPRRYVRSDGYSPTGATTLGDCSVLILERRKARHDRHEIRIRRLPAAALRKAGSATLRAVRYFGPLTSRGYKFEGITAAADGPGRHLLCLISDSKPETATALVAFSVPADHPTRRAKP